MISRPTRQKTPCGITPRFRGLAPTAGQVAHVFLTRPPRKTSEEVPVRLACIRHAASVDPEPGSNSPPISLHPSPTVVKRVGEQMACSDSFVTIPARSALPHQEAALPGQPRVLARLDDATDDPSSAHHRASALLRLPHTTWSGAPITCPVIGPAAVCVPLVKVRWASHPTQQAPYSRRADIALPVSRAARLVHAERPYTTRPPRSGNPVIGAPRSADFSAADM